MALEPWQENLVEAWSEGRQLSGMIVPRNNGRLFVDRCMIEYALRSGATVELREDDLIATWPDGHRWHLHGHGKLMRADLIREAERAAQR